MIENINGLNCILLDKITNNSQFEIGFSDIVRNNINSDNSMTMKGKNQKNSNNFKYQEIPVNDALSSINYQQTNNEMIICIYGPKEAKFRSKIKNEECFVESYIKFSFDFAKDKQRYFNSLIKNFCESLIFVDNYPRCQINIVINVLKVESDISMKVALYNGIMLALSLSGIDLKVLALTTSEDNVLITFDANNLENILSLESEDPMSIEKYEMILKSATEEIVDMTKKFKMSLVKKLLE